MRPRGHAVLLIHDLRGAVAVIVANPAATPFTSVVSPDGLRVATDVFDELHVAGVGEVPAGDP